MATSAFPNATNTGVPDGVTLTKSGGITISKAGTVVEGLDISGGVTITASNVTLKNCKITANGYVVVNIKSGLTGVVVQDCEINGTGSNNDGSHGIGGQGTFLRNDIYNVENGINVQGDNTLIKDNYIHDLKASGSPHYDGIQIDGGQSNVQILHNTVINPWGQTSAIMIDNYFGSISNITVDGNYLKGGGYTIYSDGQFDGGSISGVSITNNYLGEGGYGYYSIVENSPHMSGNITGVTQIPGPIEVPNQTPIPVPVPTPTPIPTPDPGTTPPQSGGWGSAPKQIFGDNDDNILTGGNGNDTIYAYSGDDKINGKGGNDLVSGGWGKDVFVFDTSLSASNNVDTLTYFDVGVDQIQLDNAVFTGLRGTGPLSSREFRVGDKALDSSDHIIYNPDTGVLSYDADGNGSGAAIPFAKINNHPTLSATDFLVI